METYSTAGLPRFRKAEAWNELYCARMNRVDFTPVDCRDFNVELTLSRLGPLGLARMLADSSSIERTPRHISQSAQRLYTFVLQSRGEGVLNHCGHEARLQAGDMVLCDSTAPHFFRVNDSSEILMLRVPAETLAAHVPSPNRLCGLLLKSDVGVASTAAAMVRSLSAQVQGGIAAPYDQRVASHLLEMVATSYAMAFDDTGNASAVVQGRQACIVRHIEANLRDPELSPGTIATALRMSPRYLRLVFAVSHERVSAYMLRRRLEECARQIREPAWAGHTLTEIAFSWGFNSAAHFTRSFREQYGMAPREYRRANLPQ